MSCQVVSTKNIGTNTGYNTSKIELFSEIDALVGLCGGWIYYDLKKGLKITF